MQGAHWHSTPGKQGELRQRKRHNTANKERNKRVWRCCAADATLTYTHTKTQHPHQVAWAGSLPGRIWVFFFFLARWGECDLTRGPVGKSLKALVNTAVIWGGGNVGEGEGRKEGRKPKKGRKQGKINVACEQRLLVVWSSPILLTVVWSFFVWLMSGADNYMQ